MHMVSIVTTETHIRALRNARDLGTKVPFSPEVLSGPLSDEACMWLERIWDSVEGALRAAIFEGLELAQPLIDLATQQLDDLRSKIGEQSLAVRTMLSEKIASYLREVIDSALKRAHAEITLGERQLQVSSVTIQQKINVSGSLKASLQEACAFAAAGELSISATYALGG